MSTPNSEQIKAIEHSGGVLLSAGAGSGKTFVLKEHLIYLCTELIKKSRTEGITIEEFSVRVNRMFKRTVLMTFTKKAAGELNIRLVSEFKKRSLEDSTDKAYWCAIFEKIGALNVSTIHGFCFKLISLGLFPGVSGDQDILSESQFKDKVAMLCLEQLEKKLPEISGDLRSLVLKERKSVFSSVEDIFSDPSLRYAWSELNIEDMRSDVDQVIAGILEEYGVKNLFTSDFPLSQYEEFRGKSWYDFLLSFAPYLKSERLLLEGITKIIEFLQSTKFRIPNRPRPGKIPEELIEYYSQIVQLKDILKKYESDFIAFQKKEDNASGPWMSFVVDLVSKVEEEYSKTSGITFADMEYIVYKNLQVPEVAKKIQEEFDYLIVDEFQDTSFIQYSILEKVVAGDLKRLFCVGDLKQAIYGFRGGELGVFIECSQKISQNLSLKNNYRSALDVIRFNNLFFDHVFKLGPKFEGKDPHAVEVEHQTPPESLDRVGEISCRCTSSG